MDINQLEDYLKYNIKIFKEYLVDCKNVNDEICFETNQITKHINSTDLTSTLLHSVWASRTNDEAWFNFDTKDYPQLNIPQLYHFKIKYPKGYDLESEALNNLHEELVDLFIDYYLLFGDRLKLGNKFCKARVNMINKII